MQSGIDVTAFPNKILPPSSELFYFGYGDNRLLRNVGMFLKKTATPRISYDLNCNILRRGNVKFHELSCLLRFVCRADEMWKCHEALVQLGAEVLCFLTVVYLPTEQGGCLLSCTHCVCEHQLFRMALHQQDPRAPAWPGQYHHQTRPHPPYTAEDNWRAVASTSVDCSNCSYCFCMVKHVSNNCGSRARVNAILTLWTLQKNWYTDRCRNFAL